MFCPVILPFLLLNWRSHAALQSYRKGKDDATLQSMSGILTQDEKTVFRNSISGAIGS